MTDSLHTLTALFVPGLIITSRRGFPSSVNITCQSSFRPSPNNFQVLTRCCRRRWQVSLNSVFVSFTPTIAEKNRRHIFDNDVLHSLCLPRSTTGTTQNACNTTFKSSIGNLEILLNRFDFGTLFDMLLKGV